MTFSSLPTTVDENNTIQQPRTSSCNDVDMLDYKTELADITAKCEAMQQRWSLMTAVIDQPHSAVKDDTQPSDTTQQPDPSYPHQVKTTLAIVDAPCIQIDCHATNELPSLFQQSQHLLDNMKRQSLALRNLTKMSEKLLELMTQVDRAIDALALDQPPKRYTPVLSNGSMPTTHSTIQLTSARVLDSQPQRFPSTRHPNPLILKTVASPWHRPPTELFPKPALKMKPHTRMKRDPEGPSVVRGCPGMSWTKDNLRPP